MSNNNENNENVTGLNNDVNTVLYDTDKLQRSVEQTGFNATENFTKIIREVYDELIDEPDDDISDISSDENALPSVVSTSSNSEDYADLDLFDNVNSDSSISESSSILSTSVDGLEAEEALTDSDVFLSTQLNDDLDGNLVEADNLVVSSNAGILATAPNVNNQLLASNEQLLSSNQVSAAVKNVKSNAENAVTSKASNGSGKLFNLATGTVIAGAKAGKIASKTVGKAVQFGKHFDIIDKNGQIKGGTDLASNEIKTSVKFAKRNLVDKPAKKISTKVSRKIMNKTINKVNKGITKTAEKLSAKVEKVSSKVVQKIAKAIISFISKLIQQLAEALCVSVPFIVVFLIVIIIIIAVVYFFGANLDDDQMSKYLEYISDVQTDFQEETLGYYNDNYKVDGTYNGVAYINWQAALSCIQAMQSELDASKSEFKLLDKMLDDGVMYTIEETTTKEYVLEEAVTEECEECEGTGEVSEECEKCEGEGRIEKTYSNSNSNVSFTYYIICSECLGSGEVSVECEECEGTGEVVVKEAVTTTTKYVVTVGTLDDYKDWIDANYDDVADFYDSEDLYYDEDLDSFLTDELIDLIDTLYTSEDFASLIEEAGGSISDTTTDLSGIIYNTGEYSGVLAYPTSYRTISAGYPYYSDGSEHTGIDFSCPTGTAVCACADGEVVVVKELTTSYGKYIVIKHNIDGETLYTLYAHNSTLYVEVGDTVSQGEVIALSGSTGNATGPHLHLSVLTSWSPQVYVDPEDYLY